MSRRLKSLQDALARLSSLSLPQVLSSIARDAFSSKVQDLIRRVEDSFNYRLSSGLCEHSIHFNSRLLELQDKLHEAKRAHSDFENASSGQRVAQKFESLLEELQRSTLQLKPLERATQADLHFTFDEQTLAELIVSQMSYRLKIGDDVILEKLPTNISSERTRRESELEREIEEVERARGELWEEYETLKAKYAIMEEHIKNKNKEHQPSFPNSVKKVMSVYCHKGRRSSLRATRSRSKDINSPMEQQSPDRSQVPELPLIDSPQKRKMCKTSHASNRPRGTRSGVSRQAVKPEEEKSRSFVSQPKESVEKKGGGFLETIGNWRVVSSKIGANLSKIDEQIGGGGFRVPPLR